MTDREALSIALEKLDEQRSRIDRLERGLWAAVGVLHDAATVPNDGVPCDGDVRGYLAAFGPKLDDKEDDCRG